MIPSSNKGFSDGNRRERRTTVPHEPLFTIGDLAREFGVSLRTLRFYEDRGLLAPFRDGSARYYDAKQKERLKTILNTKHLGFTLGEIRDLLQKGALSQTTGQLNLSLEQVDLQIRHLERQKADIDAAIEELQANYRKVVATQAVA